MSSVVKRLFIAFSPKFTFPGPKIKKYLKLKINLDWYDGD